MVPLSLLIPLVPLLAQPQELPELEVTRDDTVVSGSCRIVIPEGHVIRDANDNGVIHVVKPDLVVAFAPGSVLRGAPDGTRPDSLTGIGVRADGVSGVTLRGLHVRGFRVGLHAWKADGLVLEDSSFTGNFRQHLRSTPEAEDAVDWLRPHENDDNQWMRNYGAAVYLEESEGLTVRRVEVRRTQNGLVLDRVRDSRIYDNDASFLSGWGLALWRSSGNTITRNAFDFCIRGYSHGVYNRGQDSAGILLFEQCSDNVIAGNSATHGGDGVFGFAGNEALQTAGRAGCNRNILVDNDFSCAAAHGIELTFSFGNVFARNRLVENAICGVWGGYSQETVITDNEFSGNGEMGYGLERGGVNIEHSKRNVISHNTFRDNRCGVHLWWDEDGGLASKPWAEHNGTACKDNIISGNTFQGDETAIHLRDAKRTLLAGNTFNEVGQEMAVEGASTFLKQPEARDPPEVPEVEVLGKTRPVGARPELAGRENIIMTPWGPWDHKQPLLVPVSRKGGEHVYEIHGLGRAPEVEPLRARGLEVGLVEAGEEGVPRLRVAARKPGAHPYEIDISSEGTTLTAAGTLLYAVWELRVFPWDVDPRKDLEAWRALAGGEQAFEAEVTELSLQYGHGGPAELGLSEAVSASDLGGDRFGTVARTRLPLQAGTWRLETLSDDGVRVTVDGRPVIENWTWHGPTRDTGEISLEARRTVEILVEHFEIDGYAVLTLDIERGS